MNFMCYYVIYFDVPCSSGFFSDLQLWSSSNKTIMSESEILVDNVKGAVVDKTYFSGNAKF